MPTDAAFALAVAVMAAAAFATRIAGPLLMSRVKPTARTERFLEGLAVSVIAALVASQLVAADVRNLVAVIVAVTLMGLTRSVVWAMAGGMVAAAAIPFLTKM